MFHAGNDKNTVRAKRTMRNAAMTNVRKAFDDEPKGRLLSRKEALQAMGAAGLALVAGPRAMANPVPSCIVRPASTAGPF